MSNKIPNRFSNDGSFLEQFKKSQSSFSDHKELHAVKLEANASAAFANDGSFFEKFQQMQKQNLSVQADREKERFVTLPAPVKTVKTNFSSSLTCQLKSKTTSSNQARLKPSVFDDDDETATTRSRIVIVGKLRHLDAKTRNLIESLAESVASEGPAAEDRVRKNHKGNPLYWFLSDPTSHAYLYYERLLKEKSSARSKLAFAGSSKSKGSEDRREHHREHEKLPPKPLASAKVKLETAPASVFEPPTPPPSNASSNYPPVKPDADSKRRSRWGEGSAVGQGEKQHAALLSTPTLVTVPLPSVSAQSRQGGAAADIQMPPCFAGTFSQHKPSLSTNLPPPPQLVIPILQAPKAEPIEASSSLTSALLNNPQFALKTIGSETLSEEHKKQLQEQAELKKIQSMIEAKRKVAKLEQEAILMGKIKPKYEYDSDEEADDGTWEHKLRKMEMEKTKAEAESITQRNRGKRHLHEYLPPEELQKFMAKYKAKKTGDESSSALIDKSDYAQNKLTEDNIGFKMLQKMGWKSGLGLGSEGKGIVAPINQGKSASDLQGIGTSSSLEPTEADDEFDLYRKRMMLAYRFRPNPLNNPRRPYY